MNIKTLEVAGIGPAIHAMRNPMDSWPKSDTVHGHVGKLDKELSFKLANAGPEHCKHLRMVMVWAEISAPRYWWQEFDTYRAGVEKLSCSTMHRLMARPLESDDFEHDRYPNINLFDNIVAINGYMEQYKNCEDPVMKKNIWRGIIQMLPQSYIQRRTVMMSYAALRNIYRQREGHKLVEWETFRKWVDTLPESWMITDYFVTPDKGSDED